ncbi:hypothetical protein MBLNU230_g3558t1 [Neophaeotheca triangularis]
MKYSTILTGFVSAASAFKSYDGYKTYRVNANNAAADVRAALSSINVDDVWEDKLDTQGVADVVIAPDQIQAFEALGLDSSVTQEDLGAAIAEESIPQDVNKRQAPGSEFAQGYFERYHNYYDHQRFLTSLNRQYPNNSEIFSAGGSYEGRPIQGIRIFGDGDATRPAMIHHGTIHAREWITTMAVEYLAYQLLTQYNNDKEATEYVNAADHYIIPIANPDGFVFSQTQDRLWRKNRQPSGTDNPCVGTDNNRNWPYEWDALEGAGSSTDPCAQTYRGARQASAPENQALIAHMGRIRDQQGILLYIDWHSFSQLLLWPFGYDCDRFPDNNDAYEAVGSAAAEAFERPYGTALEIGPICSTIYQVAGGSLDWASERGDADFAFSYELRDTGLYGFVLPPSQIYPSVVEAYRGTSAMMREIFARSE